MNRRDLQVAASENATVVFSQRDSGDLLIRKPNQDLHWFDQAIRNLIVQLSERGSRGSELNKKTVS